YRYEISFKLLKILESLKNKQKIQIISKIETNDIISELIKIKGLIQNYHINYNSEGNLFLIIEFEKAANAFQNCIDRFILGEEEQIETTKQLLINYTNIFLTGNIANLPKEEINSENQSRAKTKIIHYVLLGLYLTLPIFIVVILKTVFKIQIDQYVQSLLQILYVVWAFIGIFSNPFILNDDNKELIRDVLKTLTGKGE
ncbi:hypothetical protein, partial [Flavobacterium sp. ACN2]|uniref:hypothetical protein n=1 Tax=Flavobacterium sp. ACN2 TaxID=1975676 RepID=UPI001555E252